MDKDARERGRRKRAELLSAADNRYIDGLAEFDEGFGRYINDVYFGDIWSRPGIPTRTRSIVTIATLMALGRFPQLKSHFEVGLRVGLTAAELKEIIIHVSQYAGIPVAVEAIRIFNEVTGTQRAS